MKNFTFLLKIAPIILFLWITVSCEVGVAPEPKPEPVEPEWYDKIDLDKFHFVGNYDDLGASFFRFQEGWFSNSVWSSAYNYSANSSVMFNNDGTFSIIFVSNCDSNIYPYPIFLAQPPAPFCDSKTDTSRYELSIEGKYTFHQEVVTKTSTHTDYLTGETFQVTYKEILGICDLFVINSSKREYINNTYPSDILIKPDFTDSTRFGLSIGLPVLEFQDSCLFSTRIETMKYIN